MSKRFAGFKLRLKAMSAAASFVLASTGAGLGDARGDVASAPGGPEKRCRGDHLCVGAAKLSVTPEQRHIDGIEEQRLFAAPKVQKFNLGGFGIDPLQNFPDPIGAFGDSLTVPAEIRRYEGSRGPEDTWVRAMVVQDPSGETVAFITLDAVGAGNVIQERLKESVSTATGIALDNILFGQTHTHAGADLQGIWGGVPQDWIEGTLYPRAAEAVRQAMRRLRPAVLEVRSGEMGEFNNYRRPKRIDPDIESDAIVTLLQAKHPQSGRVVANLLQFSGHPTMINESPRAPHPDYVLGALDWLESETKGVALYYNGPIADASSSGSRAGCAYPADGRYGEARCRGEGIAEGALSIEDGRVLEPRLSVRQELVYLPVTNPLFVAGGVIGTFNRYYDFMQLPAEEIPVVGEYVREGLVNLPQLTPITTTLVSRITLGGPDTGLEIVTIPGEATGTFGDFVRSLASPGTHVMLLGLTQNSFGYIIPEEEFSYIDASGRAGFVVPYSGYEEFVSLGPLTAPLLRAQGYLPLFDGDPGQLPPSLAACFDDPASRDCIIHAIGRHLDYVQTSFEQGCLDGGGPAEFCSLLNLDTPLAEVCEDAGLPPGMCDLLRSNPGGL